MTEFDWDEAKNQYNQKEHHVSFEEARFVFDDPNRFVIFDESHSQDEQRYYCVGKVGKRILTVRFTVRDNIIRIIGAAQWRKWRKEYERRHGQL